MREERFFVEYIGPSLNAVLGAKNRNGKWLGIGLYIGAKKAAGNAMMVSGVQHIEPFSRPVEIWFCPKIGSGHGRKEYDCLNFGIVYKIIEDLIVKCGVIRDDNRDWVHAAHCLRSELAEDGIPGIEVVIREVDAEPIGVQAGLELVEPRAF